jgi:cell volume regulation protein A
MFIIVGMLAGSEGPGGFYYDDPWSAQLLGVLALAFIIFTGGLHSSWKDIAPVFWSGVSLSTIGVFLTAILVGLFAHFFLGFSILVGLLLGAIVSSTDAAAVFSVLSSDGMGLKGRLKELLEFESASNDPVAIILTICFIHLIINPDASLLSMVFLLLKQMALGVLLGYGMGRAMVFIVNRLRLDYEGLYPVLMLALVVFTYGVTASLGGSGFLAVYIAGLMLGGNEFINKKSIMRFHDGLAWLFQITMFLILGLLVFPSQLIPVILSGLVVSLFLIFVARPAGVFASLSLSRIDVKEKAFISWVGLRGAVPIILATFPLLAGVPEAHTLFNIVFFIVITSVLLQGTTMPWVARRIGVNAPGIEKRARNADFEFPYDEHTERVELTIPGDSPALGKQVVELGLPESALIMLLRRGDNTIVPRGATVLEKGDRLLVFAEKKDMPEVRSILGLPE